MSVPLKKCSCGCSATSHVFDSDLKALMECRKCDCEGYDQQGGEVHELRLGESIQMTEGGFDGTEED